MTRAPFDIVGLELDADLDIHTEMVLADDVTMATFGHLRIYRGASLVSTSSSFILHAASAQGDVLQITKGEVAGINLEQFVLRT
jgi:hypothetical protein